MPQVSVVKIICDFDISQARHASPEHLGAGTAVTDSAQMPSELSQKPHRLVQAGRGLGRFFDPVGECCQCLPLRVGEVHGAGHFWRFLSQGGEIVDAPGHDHINRQAVLQP